MPHNRRNFLRYTTLAGLGISVNPLSAFLPADSRQASIKDEVMIPLTAGQQRITLLQTTDVHCQLHAHDEMFWENEKQVFRKAGGYAHLATYFQNVKRENPNTFIMDTGDMFQGSLLSAETSGKALQPILNALPYDLYIPGNWEVVFGKGAMLKLMGGLKAPKICANMHHDMGKGQKGELVFPPWYTWSAAGIKIGFVSYTDPLVPVRQSPIYSKGLTYSAPEESLPKYVKLLRDQEQCDFVILLSHLGLSQQIALANDPACESVDYIFGGDTHERVRKPIVCKYAKVVEPGAFGSFVGRLDLVVENGKIIRESYELVEINPATYKADKNTEAVVTHAEKPLLEEINQIVGYSTLPLYRYFVVENTIDTLVINALKWKLNTDIVLSNGFRFCPPLQQRDHTGNIPVTEGFLYDMLPVDSVVRTGKVQGHQLVQWLEKELNNVFAKKASERLGGWLVKFKGMKVTFKAFEENGRRVQEISINGMPLEPDREYTICACEREGDPEDTVCRMTGVRETKNSPYHLHEVLKDYLKAFSPVTPAPEGNALVLDAPQHLLTQVTGVDYSFI